MKCKGLCQYLCSLKRACWLLLLGSLFLVVGSFVLEYGFGAEPCRMCWWQRYTHWAILALSVIAVSGVISRYVLLYMMLLPVVISQAIAAWQTAGQIGLVELPAFCAGDGSAALSAGADLMASLQNYTAPPACEALGMTIFGLSLAMWNLIAMSAFLAFIGYVLSRVKKGKVK